MEEEKTKTMKNHGGHHNNIDELRSSPPLWVSLFRDALNLSSDKQSQGARENWLGSVLPHRKLDPNNEGTLLASYHFAVNLYEAAEERLKTALSEAAAQDGGSEVCFNLF